MDYRKAKQDGKCEGSILKRKGHQTQQLTGESLSKSAQNVVTFERPGEPQKIRRVLDQVAGKG